jgi:sugar (pentulose or hexulose) kinase
MGVGALDDWAAITAYVQPDRVFEPDAVRVAAYREAYGIYRDLYERLRTLYPVLGRLPSG